MIPIEEWIVLIRFFLHLDEEDISDEDLTIIIEAIISFYPDANDCQLFYYMLVATLNWLIRKQLSENSDSTVVRREEKRGRTEILVQYEKNSSGWEGILDMIKSDPTMIGCDPFPNATKGSPIQIGVTKDRFQTGTPWREPLCPPKGKSKWGIG